MNFYSSNARKIGVTTRSVSGVVPDVGSFESSLERDFMELSRFDSSIQEIVPQPLTISFFDSVGSERKYTPDGLLIYKEHIASPAILYEIKYREDFRDSWKKLMPKFRAAKCLAMQKGWEFKVFTEREIRTPYLDNVKFLWTYKNRDFDEEMLEYVVNVMGDLQEADPALLSNALFSAKRNQALAIPAIWHLIAHQKIGCDLNSPLTMLTRIWAKESL